MGRTHGWFVLRLGAVTCWNNDSGLVPSAVRVASLNRVDLADVDVFVLPSGTYGTALGSEFVRRLKDWVSSGGTVITIGDATRWATTEAVGLLGTAAEWKGGSAITDAPVTPRAADTPAPSQPIELAKAIEPKRGSCPRWCRAPSPIRWWTPSIG